MSGLARAVLVSGSIRWAAQILTWAITLGVARLLTPGDYGIAGLAMTIVGVGSLLADIGLGSAIQAYARQEHAVLRQLNFIALATSASIALLVAAGAPVAARFFEEPALAQVLLVGSVAILLEGTRAVPAAAAARELRFAMVAKADFARSVGASLSTVTLAAAGFGYWSLVVGNAIGSLIGAVVVWRSVGIGYALPKRGDIGGIASLARVMIVGRAAWQTWASADMFVLGRVGVASTVGLYGIAKTVASLPSEKLLTVLLNVTGPLMAEHAGDPAALRRYLLQITELVAVVIGLPLLGLCLVADLALPVVLGAQWAPAAGTLRILGVSAFVGAIGAVPLQIASSTGGATRTTAGAVFTAVVCFPLFFFAASAGGAEGVALAWLVLQVPLNVPAWRHTTRATATALRDLAGALAPLLRAGAAVSVAVLAARAAARAMHASAPLALTLLVAAGGVAGIAVVLRETTPGITALRRLVESRLASLRARRLERRAS